MISSVWQYVSGFLGALLIMLGGYAYLTIGGLKVELVESRAGKVLAEASADMCYGKVKRQNVEIARLGNDVVVAMEEFAEWKKKPRKIRYNTVYKYIPKEVMEHEESCENTNRMLDVVRHIDFNRL